jgi:hypothetical protein
MPEGTFSIGNKWRLRKNGYNLIYQNFQKVLGGAVD